MWCFWDLHLVIFLLWFKKYILLLFFCYSCVKFFYPLYFILYSHLFSIILIFQQLFFLVVNICWALKGIINIKPYLCAMIQKLCCKDPCFYCICCAKFISSNFKKEPKEKKANLGGFALIHPCLPSMCVQLFIPKHAIPII